MGRLVLLIMDSIFLKKVNKKDKIKHKAKTCEKKFKIIIKS